MVDHAVPIALPKPELEQFCRKYHIRKLALFGSVLRDDFTDQSDLDVLVEFLPGNTPGLRIVTIADELTDLLGRIVDLRTPGDLSRYFREAVLREVMLVYKQD